MILIGIDAGVNTGFAYVFDGVLREVKTLSMVEAMEQLRRTIDWANQNQVEVCVFIEDARKRKWYGGNEKLVKARLQGVGSVKRDCAIWQEFCEYHDVAYQLIAPKNNRTKLSAEEFKMITGWQHRTSEHARDAVMLVWGR